MQSYDDDLGGDDVSLTQLLGMLTTGTLESTHDVESAAILIRTPIQDGDPSWGWRVLGQIPDEELIGALQVQAELLERRIVRDWYGGREPTERDNAHQL